MADRESGPTDGARTFVTILFSDLCGSTRLAAGLDPDDYAQVLESVRAVAARHIEAQGGQVAQIYGDGLLAIFPEAGSCAHAIAAARALHAGVAALPAPPGKGPLLMHSGVHAGLVVLKPGDSQRGRLEAVGRPTGIAARLAAAARPDEILVSRGTLGPDGRRLPLGTARPVAVSGADDVVTAVPVMGETVGGASPIPASPVRLRPFIGRDALLARIDRWFDTPRAALPASLALVAPPGQGKSRLSEEVERRAVARGLAVLRGVCDPAAVSPTLQPFHEIDAAARRHLVDLGLPGDAGEVSAKAIRERIVALAARQPLLLVLDDWHWADSISIGALARLGQSGARLFLLILSREAAPRGVPIAAATVEMLEPFGLNETSALARLIRPDLDPLDIARIHERAGGNPLYVEELCQLPARALRAPPAPRPDDSGSGWLSTLIADRVRSLEAGDRGLLETAAVIGTDCPLWQLSALAQADAVHAPLARLQEAELLIPSLSAGAVRFKHGITRDVVYSLVPRERRTALHARLAALLATADGLPAHDRDEALARHYAAGGDPLQAAIHADRAGDRAMALGGSDRAQSYYGLALTALEAVPDADARPRVPGIAWKFGMTCVYDSDVAQLDILGRVGARAAGWGDAETEAVAAHWQTYVLHGLGRQTDAIRQCRHALALTAQAPDSPMVVQLRSLLGQVLVAAGRYGEGAPLLAEAIAIKQQHRSGRNASAGLAYALTLQAAMHADQGRFALAQADIAEALTVLGGQPHPVEASVIGWASSVFAWQGDWEGLLATASRACALAVRIETVYIHAISRAFAAFARWKLDAAPDAVAELRAAIACMEEQGKGLALSMGYGLLAEVMADIGDVPATRRATERAYRRFRLGEPFGVAQAARAWARLVAPGDPARAMRFLSRARANARLRQSAPEEARTDMEIARLGLLPAAESQALAAAAADRFRALGMPRFEAEARALSGGETGSAGRARRRA